MKLGGAKHLGLRRLDAALLLLARLFQSGVEPPQSKALSRICIDGGEPDAHANLWLILSGKCGLSPPAKAQHRARTEFRPGDDEGSDFLPERLPGIEAARAALDGHDPAQNLVRRYGRVVVVQAVAASEEHGIRG